MQTKKLINEMNKINSEISGLFQKKRWKEECNVQGCKNKPIHKLYLKQFNRILYSCKKHRNDFGESYVEVKL